MRSIRRVLATRPSRDVTTNPRGCRVAGLFQGVEGGRFPHRVAGQLLLAGFGEVLVPTVGAVRGDAVTPIQIGHALLASQSLEDDADLFPGRELGARSPMKCLLAQANDLSESC